MNCAEIRLKVAESLARGFGILLLSQNLREVILAALSGCLGHSFNFVTFGDGVALHVMISGHYQLFCQAFFYRAWIVYSSLSCSFGYMSKCQVNSPLWCNVH
jgi:hypothetical protein